MLRLLIVCVLGGITAGCGYFDVKPRESEDGPIIARAFFSNESCSGAAGTSEFAGAPALVTAGVTKAAELAVGYIADAVAKAAEADKKTFTIVGQNADYLFSVQGGTVKMRSCLYVAVAPRVANAKFCPPSKNDVRGNWYNSSSCQSAPQELVKKWEDWSLGTPTFYAEISFRKPKGGPDTALIPEVHKIYYPKPVSTMGEDKVKGFSILVSAAKPTKSNVTSGDTVLEVFIGGEGVTPKTVREDLSFRTSGLWVAVPAQDGKLGESFAGPVNLTVTVAETPNPTAWLQAVNSFIAANKQKAVDKIVSSADPATKTKDGEKD